MEVLARITDGLLIRVTNENIDYSKVTDRQ
jgi:hypothetical protein